MGRLQDKVAVITGGSSGIGLAMARRFVEEGAVVYITGRRQEELDKAVSQIGGAVSAIRGDATDKNHLDELLAQISRDHGRLDVLVANSGLVQQVRLEDVDDKHFERTFTLNARAPLFLVQKALPLMRTGGSIILIGSIVGSMGFPAHSTYGATKAAMRSYARTWTAEFRDNGVRVNIISPGPIDTPIIDNQTETKEEADALRAKFASVVPLARMGRPDEIANAALFLASDESSYVAGAELFVDGGMSAV